MIDKELASAIQVGVDNKDSVDKTLGRPTFTGQFAPNDWYYVSRDTNPFAFRDPRVLDQTVLHVRFDPAGNVARSTTGKELIADVDPVERADPDPGPQAQLLRRDCSAISARSASRAPGSSGNWPPLTRAAS